MTAPDPTLEAMELAEHYREMNAYLVIEIDRLRAENAEFRHALTTTLRDPDATFMVPNGFVVPQRQYCGDAGHGTWCNCFTPVFTTGGIDPEYAHLASGFIERPPALTVTGFRTDIQAADIHTCSASCRCHLGETVRGD